MSEEHKTAQNDRLGSGQQYPKNAQGGYQPRSQRPLDVKNVKPPRGDTAAKPPEKSQAKDAK